MERHILKYSYLLGIILAAAAIVWRAALVFGVPLGEYVPGERLGYMTCYKGAFLFLLVAVASALVIQTQSAKS